MSQIDIFNDLLAPELADDLRRLNPHWAGLPGPEIPSFHRHLFHRIYRNLQAGLTPATVLRGTRRVGKTILVRQVMEKALAEGVAANRILYVPFDEIGSLRKLRDPILTIARWYESKILACTLNEAARSTGPAYLLFDEVQNLDAWAPQIKHLVDNNSVRVLLTGSSSLRIEAGRDSLAGRITTLDLGPLLLREIAELSLGGRAEAHWVDNEGEPLTAPEFWMNGIAKARDAAELRLRAFSAFSSRGGYPIAHERADAPWQDMAGYLNETIVKRAIQHDLRLGPRGAKRDEKLLEEVFRLCCRYAGQAAGQSAFVPEIRQALAANIGWSRILTYMRFLDGTLLVRLIPAMELRLKKRKAPAKICLGDHSLRASWLQEIVPLDPQGLNANSQLTDLAGHLAESVLGYFLASIPNLELAHFPARGAEPEVDFVLTVGTRRIPIEVKYRRRIDPHDDTRGLRAFIEKTVYNAPFGLLVTLEDDVRVPDPRIIPVSLSALLWMR
ncbi:MAG: ATP-binding protein [Betaproteobacteria bacterium]|nr:ATP-binding protein [Betaproteobacteria bacterium]